MSFNLCFILTGLFQEMPLFKVYGHDRAKKVIVCAPTLPELLAGAFKKLQLSGSVEDYKVSCLPKCKFCHVIKFLLNLNFWYQAV